MVLTPLFRAETCSWFSFTKALNADIVVFLSENASTFRHLKHTMSMLHLSSITLVVSCALMDKSGHRQLKHGVKGSTDPTPLLEVGINNVV